VVGGTPLMLDAEPTGSSRPSVGDCTGFIDAYRRLGGIVNLVYLPRWYWQQLGSPGLGGLASRKCGLVSSAYTAYSDAANGTGWMPYGGITPSIWQYTDKHSFNGQPVDFNAYRGSLAQQEALAVRAELVSCRPSCVPLHSLPGAPWVCALPRRAATDRRPR
jgi:lysozyme